MKPCPRCRDRGDLPLLLAEMGLTGTGVEVGVRKGCFAQIILAKWPGTLHLVDPWAMASQDYREAERADADSTWNDAADYALTLERVGKFGDRAVVHCRTSVEAAKVVPDPVDFAYVDADHRYEHVLEDCRLWWAKLRIGGVLSGHDILYFEQMQVTQAVLDFAREWGVEVMVIRGSSDNLCRDGGVASWYMVKR